MAAELGRPKFGAGVCATLDDVIRGAQMLDDALGNPTVPTDNTVNTVEIVYYDGSTLVTINGDVISPGGTTTIVVQWNDVAINSATGTLNFEGTAVTGVVDDGAGKVTVTIDATAGAFSAGDGIDIDGGGVISVDLAATSPCLEFDGGDIRVQVKSDGGLERTSTGLQDKWRYFEVKGTATSAGTPHTGTVGIDNVTSINGETPVAMSSDVLTCFTEVDVYVADNDVLYATFTLEGAGLSSYWSVANMKNLRPILAGLPDYAPASTMLLGHKAGETDSSQQKVQWKTIENWLKLVTGYNAANKQVIVNNVDTVAWMDLDDALNLLASYTAGNDQSIGHDASGVTAWQADSVCP
jgi:hypothetical protein